MLWLYWEPGHNTLPAKVKEEVLAAVKIMLLVWTKDSNAHRKE